MDEARLIVFPTVCSYLTRFVLFLNPTGSLRDNMEARGFKASTPVLEPGLQTGANCPGLAPKIDGYEDLSTPPAEG